MLASALAGILAAAGAAACDDGGRRSRADALIGCRLRAEGPPGLPRFDAARDLRAGPATFYGLRSLAATARRRAAGFFGRTEDGYPAHKVLAGIRAGGAVRVAVVGSSRPRAGLAYDARGLRSGPLLQLDETDRSILFRPCPPNHPRFRDDGVVGGRTDFAGGVLVTEPQCLRLRVGVRGGPARSYVVAFGVPRGSC